MTASKRAREISMLGRLLDEFGDLKLSEAIDGWKTRLLAEFPDDPSLSTAIERLHAIAHDPPPPKKRKLKWGPDEQRVFYAESMERRKADESIDDLVARMRDLLEKHGLELKPRPAAEQKMDLKAKSLQRRFYAGKAEMRKVLREFLGDDAKLDEELGEDAK